MDFRYKNWTVRVEKDLDTQYFIWEAVRTSGIRIGDPEGGCLGDMKNAKYQIKEWLDEYERDPFAFKMRHPELVRW